MFILLCSLLDVILSSSLILDSVNFDCCNGPFHIPELSSKFVKSLWVFLLILKNLILSWHYIIIVKLSDSLNVFLLIIRLGYVVNVADDLENCFLLLFCACFLRVKIMCKLAYFRVLSFNFLLICIDLLHLILKHFFKI